MSFILDALKKSEAERQRQAGPTLLEVRITPPRRRYPSWLAVVTALLLANVAVLLAFLLRHPPATPAAPAAVAAVPSAPAPPPPNPSASASRAASLPANDVLSTPTPAAAATAPPVVAASAPAPTVTSGNAADDQPAIEPAAGGTNAAKAPPAGIDLAALPSFNEVAGSVPDLRLDLHVYDDQPSKRYALINMHRVREGDMLPEGARVLAITAAGVALDYRGQQFMLHPQ